MNSITVHAEHEYQVVFKNDVFSQIAAEYSDREIVLVAPESLKNLIQTAPKNWHLITTKDAEQQKSGENYLEVLEQVAGFNLSRKGLLVGFGGGATTDLTGFVAATYLRGIDWVAVPTSLAGMVDAAVGGKTGINLAAGKNLAGVFHSPIQVLISVDLLASLPERDLLAGMAEVVKCGFIADRKILEIIEDDWRSNLPELIHRSVSVKAKVVSEDFKESYLREVLNYGHTLGHAIEKHSNYSLRHGEAVAIGMIFAAEMSQHFSGLDKASTDQHYRILNSLNLPISYPKQAWHQLLDLMQHDKKKGKTGLRFVTLSEIGQAVRCENPSEQVMQEIYLAKIGV